LKVAGRQATTALFVPQKKGGGLVLEGDPAELADKLIGILKEKNHGIVIGGFHEMSIDR
jgi:electron transfer flavoprotein beta subunit